MINIDERFFVAVDKNRNILQDHEGDYVDEDLEMLEAHLKHSVPEAELKKLKVEILDVRLEPIRRVKQY